MSTNPVQYRTVSVPYVIFENNFFFLKNLKCKYNYIQYRTYVIMNGTLGTYVRTVTQDQFQDQPIFFPHSTIAQMRICVVAQLSDFFLNVSVRRTYRTYGNNIQQLRLIA